MTYKTDPTIRRGKPRLYADKGPSLPTIEPQPGYYRTRLIKGGPTVPVRILQSCPIDPEFGFPTERSRPLYALCLGDWYDPLRIWPYCVPISLEEFETMEGRCRAVGIEGRRARSRIEHGTERSLY